jgi:hypothetical protein
MPNGSWSHGQLNFHGVAAADGRRQLLRPTRIDAARRFSSFTTRTGQWHFRRPQMRRALVLLAVPCDKANCSLFMLESIEHEGEIGGGGVAAAVLLLRPNNEPKRGRR